MPPPLSKSALTMFSVIHTGTFADAAFAFREP
jgi:hypothetical protein